MPATMLWVALLLVCGEAAVRGRALLRHGTPEAEQGLFQSDASLGTQLRPGAVLIARQRSLHVNRWGFRGGEIDREKPAGTVRVAVLGDSITFGLEASSDEAVWPARMQELLNAGDGRRYEVINGGVPGYDLTTSTMQLERQIADFDPDIVVVYQVSSDLTAHARRQHGSNEPTDDMSTSTGLNRVAQNHSLLLRLVTLNTTAFRSRNIERSRHDALDAGGLALYRERLERLIDLCRERGWGVVLCTCPRAFDVREGPGGGTTNGMESSALAAIPWLSATGVASAYDAYNGVIREAAAQRGVTLVELDRALPRGSELFADAVHLTDAGHAAVAAAVAGVVARVKERARVASGGADGV
jgi:lysophospholipase L1-like esterase